MESQLLTTAEAALYVRRNVRYVQQVIRYEVPVIQRGGRGTCFYRISDLDKWLARNRKVPAK